MSSSDEQRKSAPKQGDVPASKIPAGLETLYALEKENIKSSLGALILAVHWSIVRAGLRIPTSRNSDKKFTERLPPGWSEQAPNSPTPVFTFDYVDPVNPDMNYQVKVIEIVPNQTAVVTVYKHKSASPSGSQNPVPAVVASSSTNHQQSLTSASTFQLPNFIRFDQSSTVQDQVSPESVFYNATELENQIWSELMEPLGLKVLGLPPFQGPYDDKSDNKKETDQQQQQQQRRQPLYEDDPLREGRYLPRSGPPPAVPGGGFGPLYVPPVGGGGGLGRSDLDPLGGIGAGMISDPRGFRQPRNIGPGRLPPGAVPPGARFDPFGPPMPANPGTGTGTGPNWSVPNPDVPPPPGYDDMFM